MLSRNAERIKMGLILRQIEKIYKNALLCRRDDDGTLFYFSVDDFPGLQRTAYSFKTKKGHTLRGYFYHYRDFSEYDKNRLVIFEHGMGVGHRAYMKEIEMLASRGYLVYSYDHTGCTESEGEHIMGLSGSLADLDACITALKNDGYAEEGISVVGHSWGGFSALNILAFHKNLRSIVAMSGFISLSDMQKQVVPGILAPFRSHLYEIERAMNPDYISSSAISVLTQTDRDVLVIHSLDDDTVSAKRHYLRLKSALSGKENVSFITLTDRGHNPNYTAEAVKYKAEFFRAHKKRIKKNLHKDKESQKVFLSSYDWHKITEQDKEIWRKIYDFLDK